MKCGQFRTIVGILKIVGIVLAAIAGSIGVSSYVTSEFNKSCKDSVPFPTDITKITIPSLVTDFTGTTTMRTRETTTSSSVSSSSTPFTTGPSGATEKTSTSFPESHELCQPIMWMERFYVVITWGICAISVVLLVVGLFMDSNKTFTSISFVFYFVGCIFLIVSAIFMAFAATQIDRKVCQDYSDSKEDCQAYKQKMIASAVALLLAAVYAVISYKIVGSKLFVHLKSTTV